MYNEADDKVFPSKTAECGNVKFPHSVKFNLSSSNHLSCNNVSPISFEEAVKLEHDTIAQSESDLWFQSRKKRITASQFGHVLKRKKAVNEKFLKSIFESKSFTSCACNYGKNHEAVAKGTYVERNKNIHIHDCGLVVNPSYSFLGASPDGKVCDKGTTGILEVKCPYSARDILLTDAANSVANFCLDTNMQLKKSHEYYFQVQGQLLVTGAPFCDFLVYTDRDFSVQRIYLMKQNARKC